jgi:3-deoxy-D-manno-octulosonate 8-phosphate phosphatase (KDO 8-P phosphatase)
MSEAQIPHAVPSPTDMTNDQFSRRCRAIRLVLTDVDGVWTDGFLHYLPDGGEAKSFHVRDGLGVGLAHAAGLLTGILTGRESVVVGRRATELGMSVVRQGVAHKLATLHGILEDLGFAAHEVAYIGDDLNDLPVIREVGLSAAPADAPLEVRAEAFLVTETPGGRGAYREFIEAILKARGCWEETLAAMQFSAAAPPPQ